MYRTAVDQLHLDGIVVDGHRGVRSKHPAAQIARDCLANVIGLAARFGLSPADRARLDIGDQQPMAGDDLLTGGAS